MKSSVSSNRKRSKLFSLGFIVTTFCVSALGASATDENPLELRKVMQELGGNLAAITESISREDWQRVAHIAPLIADHPKPPMGERAQILALLGADMGRFKAYDGQTHQTAEALAEAAQKGDGEAVITVFAELQRSCLGCHENFRQKIIEHFYVQK